MLKFSLVTNQWVILWKAVLSQVLSTQNCPFQPRCEMLCQILWTEHLRGAYNCKIWKAVLLRRTFFRFYRAQNKRNSSKLVLYSLRWSTNYNTVVWWPWHVWDFNFVKYTAKKLLWHIDLGHQIFEHRHLCYKMYYSANNKFIKMAKCYRNQNVLIYA